MYECEWSLETTEDADVRICIVLNEAREYTIGRRKGYDIVSPNPLVSRNHGVITVKPDGRVYIKDLKSANGTYINDEAIQPFNDVLLKQNDILGIGAPRTAIEPKKEIFWVRCKRIHHTEPIVVNEDHSTNIEEPQQPNGIENEEVSDLENDLSDHQKCPDNVATKNITLQEIKNNTNEHLDPIVTTTDENVCNLGQSTTNNINSDNHISEAENNKNVEKPRNPDLINNATCSTNNGTNCKSTKNPSAFLQLPELINNQNKASTSAERSAVDVKLDVNYLNTLIEKRKKIKSTTEIIICSSSDEEETRSIKNDKSTDQNRDKSNKTNNNECENDDSNLNKISIKTEPKNHSCTENGDINRSTDSNHQKSNKTNNDECESDDSNVNRIKIKTEPINHSFTQNDYDDIVIVSDDDDEIFPRSQIFGDINVEVKREPVENDNATSTGNCTSPVSDNNDNPDNIFLEIVKNEIPDYDYNDNNEDTSDDDACSIWYSKLSQSQDFISSQVRNKDASPEAPEVVEQDDFPKFDNIDLEIFGKDFDSGESSAASAVPSDDEQLKSNDAEVEPDDTTDKISASSSKLSSTEKKKHESKKSYVKPPVIDAPFLIKGKRKLQEEAKSKETTSSKPKRRKSTLEDVPPVQVPITTASVLNIDKSVRNEFDKRHKNKKRRPSTETFSKKEKKKILEDRKKKLKELASKSSESKEKKGDVQKSHTTPKVKVSSSRGLFLTGVDSKQESKNKKKSDTVVEEPPPKKPFRIPKRSDSISSEPSTSKASMQSEPLSSKTSKLPLTVNKEKETSQASKSEAKEQNAKKTNKQSFNKLEKESDSVEKPRRPSVSNNNVTNKSNGILQPREKNSKSVKKVTFKEEPEIFYIERIAGNNCRKVNSKDAPVPLMTTNVREDDELLSKILEWHPAWLEEQKKISASPQVSRRKPLRMLTNFNSFRDYFDIVSPLMLLELWRCVFRDWCQNNAEVKLACIENIRENCDNLYLTCYCLTKDDSDNYFRNGDLLAAEFYLDEKNAKTATIKKFAYVTNVNKRRMALTDILHKQLTELVPLPKFKVIFNLQIKKLQVRILEEKLMRIRFVSRLAPQLRILKSVSFLHTSPLCDFILRPNVQRYKITKPAQMRSAIEDNLNNDQMMCVYEAYQICTRNEPGIYLIQGPPGTGKSYVIKNLIRQLLWGATKNKTLPKCRILLCASSNGAVDEIANTLLEMRSKMAKNDRFKMIRLGPPQAILNEKVKRISVPILVENFLTAQHNSNLKTNSYMSEEYNFLIQKENTIKNKIMFMAVSSNDYFLEQQKLRKVQEDLQRLKLNANTNQERRKLEKDTEIVILEGAEIICTTLSSCVGSKLEELVNEKRIEFTCCIVDEATQSSEPESLIPLLLGINKLVLVGDPEQLPPTIISQEAKELGHGNSLFSRIQKCLEHLPENPIRMLTEQYRMHPEICKFPSKNFYGGRLKTAEITTSKTENILDPCRLFCLNSSIDYKANEYLNKTEGNLVLLLADIVVKRTNYNVGIITPYTKQKKYLMDRYSAMRGKENKENIDKDEERHQTRVAINTVDGFQGQERDVIIISSVRYKSNIFLNDLQRLNVALTRAKHAVFICAHANLFKNDSSIWQKLESDAKSRTFFYALTEKDATDERYLSELILRRR